MCTLFANVLGFKTISINYDTSMLFNLNNLIIKNGTNVIKISNYSFYSENKILIFLTKSLNIKFECSILYKSLQINASYSKLFLTSEFNDEYFYSGELGFSFNLNYSTFKLWSPAATNVSLLIYNNGDISIKETPREFKMTERNGVWNVTINENLKNKFYTYKILVYNNSTEVIDPYARAVGINGVRAAIIDFKETNPPNWTNDSFIKCINPTDAIIYETNIADISISDDSSIKNKGLFLGLTEDNTSSPFHMSTGLSHLKELGITHIQLMPIFDFSYISINERRHKNYNWGYDPQNYNVPEGTYSSNPYNPICRILELKTLIKTLHKNNIAINMDIVFNHIFHKHIETFENIFPEYYFRYDDNGKLCNGSGCSNDIASENKMVQKFILDSITYWCKEYHIDGFRFDLMGLHDINTMNTIYNSLKLINPSSMIYGEGWNLDTSLPYDLRAIQENCIKIPNIGFFNDTIRNCIAGSPFSKEDKGFILGSPNLEDTLKFCISGSCIDLHHTKIPYTSPCQSINYASCHDNYTLWDKISISSSNDSIDDKKNMLKLACGIILTSQGIPFFHSGVEFCRTKHGISNSFNSSYKINSIDYQRKYKFKDVFYYIKSLITLRKNHPAFRMYSTDDIKNNLKVLENTPTNTLAFILKNHANNDTFKNILVIYNSNKFTTDISLPSNSWNQIVNKNHAGENIIKTVNLYTFNADSLSLNILFH